MSLNLHWDTLINKVSDFINLVALLFLKISWSLNCTLSFSQIYYTQTSTSWIVCRLKFQVRSFTPENIHQGYTQVEFPIDIMLGFVNSVINFKHRSVKMFISNLRLECQKSLKRFQTILKI